MFQTWSGPHYTLELGKFAIDGGFDATLLYGKMKIDGFDIRAMGWGTYPIVSVGFHTNGLTGVEIF